jgi:hypothetical protein
MNNLLASGPTLAVIPTVTALTIRHFRHQQGSGGGAERGPKHPAVRFILGAWNNGDFSQAYQHIAPGIKIYTNGLPLSSDHGGPAMARESIESWRTLAPDLRLELSQEIRDKQQIGRSRSRSGSPEPTPGTSPGCRPVARRSTSRAPHS